MDSLITPPSVSLRQLANQITVAGDEVKRIRKMATELAGQHTADGLFWECAELKELSRVANAVCEAMMGFDRLAIAPKLIAARDGTSAT